MSGSASPRSSRSRQRRRRVADRLHTTAIRLLRGLRQEDAASGLGPARLSALSVLVFGGPRSPSQLAAAEGVRPPTMTRIVQGLERDGHVRRRRSPQDGRAVELVATARGRRAMERARDLRVAVLAERLSGLTADELAYLEEAAEILERAMR